MRKTIRGFFGITVVILIIAVVMIGAGAAYTGSGTEDDPYLITSQGDLEQLATDVNGGTGYSGTYFALTTDLTLSDWKSSIGNSKTTPFKGVFNGKYGNIVHKITYAISECYTDDGDKKGYTLFGYVFGENAANRACIKNLNVEANYGFADNYTFLKKDMFSGLIIGTKDANIENITVSSNNTWNITSTNGISERLYVGGISVYDYGGSSYKECINNVSVNVDNYVLVGGSQWAQYFTFGGIIGRTELGPESGMFTVIQNCVNHGNLVQANPYDIDMTGKDKGYFAQRTVYGGIVGQINYADKANYVLVIDCSSDGTCRGSGNCYWDGTKWNNANPGNQGSRGYFVGERWVSAGNNGYQKYGIAGTSDFVEDYKNTICWGQRYYTDALIDVSSLTAEGLATSYPAANATYRDGGSHYFEYYDGSSVTTLNDNTIHSSHLLNISDCEKLVGTFASYYNTGAVVIFGKVATPVAKIKETGVEYTTLQDAINAVQNGQTIELLKDVDLTNYAAGTGHVFNFVDNVTLDLKTHTITSNNFGVVYQGNNLKIKNGKFVAANGGSYALFVGDTSKTTGVVLDNLQCTGGINFFNVTATVKSTNNNTEVTGTKYYALWCDEGADVTVDEGAYSSPSTTGGVVIGTTSDKSDESSILIKGGTFTTQGTAKLFDDNNFITITGGTFNTDPSKYVPTTGYVVVQSGDTWVVKKTETVTIEHVAHTTADGSASPAAAYAGQEVTLTPPTCEEGYSFTGWTSSQVMVTDNKFTMPAVAVIVTPEVSKDGHVVTFVFDEDMGSVSPTSINGIVDDTPITEVKNTITINGTTVTATPDTGYQFKEWNGIPESRTVTGNLIITAVFEDMPGKVVVSNENVNFGTIQADNPLPSPQTLTIQNGTRQTVSLDILGEASDAFDYEPALYEPITPGTTRVITITPVKKAVGNYEDTLLIFDDKDIYQRVLVKFNVVVPVPEEKKDEVIVPVTPVVETKDVGNTQVVVIDETKNDVEVKGDTVQFSNSSATSEDGVLFTITEASVTTVGEVKTVALGEDSKVSVAYAPKKAEDAEGVAGTVQYTVNLNLKDVDTNVPSLSGEYKNDVANVVAGAYGYQPVYMLSSLNTDVESIDANIKETEVAFLLGTDEIPSGKKPVVVHVSGAKATRLSTESVYDKSGNLVVTGTNPNGGFSSYVLSLANLDPEPVIPTPSHSSSGSATFSGAMKNGNVFTFTNAVVVKEATLPGATSATITNRSGSGWYNFDLSAPGFTGNGSMLFEVPLDVLKVKEFTVNDVGLYHQENGKWVLKPTVLLSKDSSTAYYKGTFDSCSAFMINFEKGATSTAGTVVTPVTEPKTDTCTLSITGVSSVIAGDKVVLKAVCTDGHQHVYTWKVSDPTIASVDANGNLNGLKAGMVTITVTDDDGHSASRTITVVEKAEPTTQTTKSPFPVLGILTGLGFAGVLVLRRKL